MRNFTSAFFSVVILILLLSIILPSMGYTLAPQSGADGPPSQSTANKIHRFVFDPDSPLYPIELGIEKLQFSFTPRHGDQAQLLLRFAEERAAESAEMVNKNKPSQAAQAVSDMVNNLRTLEEMRDYLPSETANDIDNAILQLKEDSAVTIADILNKLGETVVAKPDSNQPNLDNIRDYIRSDKDYQDSIAQLQKQNSHNR